MRHPFFFILIFHPFICPCEGEMEIKREGEEREESMKNEDGKKTHFLCEIRPVQMDEIVFCLTVFF